MPTITRLLILVLTALMAAACATTSQKHMSRDDIGREKAIPMPPFPHVAKICGEPEDGERMINNMLGHAEQLLAGQYPDMSPTDMEFQLQDTAHHVLWCGVNGIRELEPMRRRLIQEAQDRLLVLAKDRTKNMQANAMRMHIIWALNRLEEDGANVKDLRKRTPLVYFLAAEEDPQPQRAAMVELPDFPIPR